MSAAAVSLRAVRSTLQNKPSLSQNKRFCTCQKCATLRAPSKRSLAVRPMASKSNGSGDSKTTEQEWEAGAWWDRQIAKGADIVQNYGQARWREHERPWRYWRHTVTLPESRVLTQLTGPLLFIGAVATAVCSVYSYAAANAMVLPQLSMVPLTLTSSVIGLLLVFRTNTSFARFWEARSLWGLIVNRTRDMNRQSATWFSKDDPAEHAYLRAIYQRWTAAFVYSLKCHLRERGNLASDLKNILPPEELSALLASKHRPLYCLQVLSETIASSKATDYMKAVMDKNLTALEDAAGACEKILRTAIPLSYTRHTSRFLVIWLTALPLALWSSCGWATIPVSMLIGFCMLGIEFIGVIVEEPFKKLALDAICATIHQNTLELLDTHGPSRKNADGTCAYELVAPVVAAA
uniref:Putative membrane protein n=1 Tax=Tetraselmis sp. GSL018 TaxID=582737 RepID=A0A061RKJ5_9CHLO|eukprot:CAMPEP_0177582578 /NCGR_PEP_ID=MMETSP0419_2-20121207/2832_1 /TAXON_ID=582737 /ORGANISM="Tetraselmis sp., Strain GSL018" /LENGTH=406 /DNA_ID=CAMNT_0019071849 /DNA_START=37 /DNA_END=1257 /DNA_ORIENTATION=+